MGKGASFERNICRELSEWWSSGIGKTKEDDYFWRSSQSGGRATQRAKSGKKTFGSYGDITALNPLGAPLIKYFTIELKRGYSDVSPYDLVDCKPTKKVRSFEKMLNQAMKSATQAGSNTWLLLCKPDRRQPMCYMPNKVWKLLSLLTPAPAKFALRINPSVLRTTFVGVPFAEFKKIVRPIDIVKALE